jgi:methionyl aminopeptidase
MTWDRVINIKTPAEIAIMREAGRINYAALDAAKKAVRPGVTTADLNALAEEVIKAHGAYSPFLNYPGPTPYPASICTSINEELVHGIPGKRKLVEGDIISMDCGTVFEGFVADSAITVGVGELGPVAKKLIEVTEGALEAGIAKMVAGLYIGDISACIQEYVESRGYNVTRVYTGHGVGRQMHEGPQVPNYGEPGTGLLIKTGMTIALEPMVLIGTQNTRVLRDGWTVISTDRSLTAHSEHSVAVTESGPLVLTLP